MKATNIIREVMRIREVKPSVLASKLNIKNNVLSERLNQRNISVVKLDEMLKVMDYKATVVPVDCPVPENGFEIDCQEDTPCT